MSQGYSTFSSILKLTRTLSSAEILSLQSTPVVLLAAPGAGLTYEFYNIMCRLNFNTAVYTTNLNLAFYFANIGNAVATNSAILSQNASRSGMILRGNFSSGSDQYPPNTSFKVSVNNAGNPLAGDGTLSLYISYNVIPLG
jgi:hypothetical protein